MALANATALAPPHRTARAMRVMVLDDDPVFRAVLAKMLTGIGLEVVATVGTIDSAKQQLARNAIDAVTVDVVLRGESGLDFLTWCHQTHRSVLTVLVTAGTERGARTGVDAVFLGAAALLTKPEARSIAGFEAELRRVFNNGSHSTKSTVAVATGTRFRPGARRDLLAVGASTGGPPVLLKLLKGLPVDFDPPIIITQHMPALHIPYLAELLTQQSGHRIVVATDGVLLQKRTTYLAGNAKHLLVERRGTQLVARQSDTPPEHFCKPAVDPMFRSVAATGLLGVLGVVLTGMGSDGAKGAVALRAAGTPVLIQDEASSVVWGMPGSVAAAGAADAVFAADRVAGGILEWMGYSRGLVR
jgi:two-component system chemotaxis response regulator CheB